MVRETLLICACYICLCSAGSRRSTGPKQQHIWNSSSASNSSNASHASSGGGSSNYTNTYLPVRLAAGYTRSEGRVEVLHNGRWGTVCDDYFNHADAAVVCHQLGLPPPTHWGSWLPVRYKANWKPILLDDVTCIGNESSLGGCRHRGIGRHNCHHSEDVSVRCGHVQRPATNHSNATNSSNASNTMPGDLPRGASKKKTWLETISNSYTSSKAGDGSSDGHVSILLVGISITTCVMLCIMVGAIALLGFMLFHVKKAVTDIKEGITNKKGEIWVAGPESMSKTASLAKDENTAQVELTVCPLGGPPMYDISLGNV